MKTEKYCPQCKETLPLDKFCKNRSARLGVSDYCKECRNRIRRENYKQPPQTYPDLPNEIWKTCAQDDRYAVSNLGRVKRLVDGIGTRAGKIHGQVVDKDGYMRVMFGGMKTRTNHTVHKLVATAFIGLPPNGTNQINHLNGVKADNRVENLEWCNAKHNSQWKDVTGTSLIGEKHHQSKLKNKDIPIIRKMLDVGQTYQSIADKFGVSKQTIWGIKSGKGWSKVE